MKISVPVLETRTDLNALPYLSVGFLSHVAPSICVSVINLKHELSSKLCPSMCVIVAKICLSSSISFCLYCVEYGLAASCGICTYSSLDTGPQACAAEITKWAQLVTGTVKAFGNILT